MIAEKEEKTRFVKAARVMWWVVKNSDLLNQHNGKKQIQPFKE